jgi:hypothetical protein
MRIEITHTEPAFEGASFGDVGGYEKIVGRALGEVDAAHPLNANIVDLDKAPTDAAGRVAYACDFYLLRPVDPRRGNRRIFYDVPNRGGKVALHTLNDAPRDLDRTGRIACNDPTALADAGNGFLMRQGYTIVWSGWQGDVPGGEGRMGARLPVVAGTGTSRDEFLFEHMRNPVTAALSYPASTTDQAACALTVRQRARDPRIAIAPGDWRFISDSAIEITRPAGFDAGAIYEFVHPARDSIVMGLGFAVVRDLIAFLRHDTGPGNPLAAAGIEHALAYGLSQAGRFLRDFAYHGFNEDLHGRRVFDGMLASMAGSRKTFVNHAFAQPGRFARQHEDRLFPHDQFPFSYATTIDPVSGRTDGILARCAASGTCPKILQTESSSDFFHGRASLLVSDGAGNEIPVPDGVRLYHFAGVQHGGGGDPTVDYARIFPSSLHPHNPADVSGVHRALLVALDRWVSDDTPPPPSQFPSVRDGSLVSGAPETYRFPAIPGVAYPGRVNELAEIDHGVQPPVPIAGRDYAVLVPAIAADGNERAGIRVPAIAVPRATHTGWNPRRAGYAEGELGAVGAYFPFAATRRERLETGDPRLSLEERYPTGDAYVRKVAEAAAKLKVRGLLLPEDVDRIVAEAIAIGTPLRGT